MPSSFVEKNTGLTLNKKNATEGEGVNRGVNGLRFMRYIDGPKLVSYLNSTDAQAL